MLNEPMLGVTQALYAEYRYAECRFAECRYTECLGALTFRLANNKLNLLYRVCPMYNNIEFAQRWSSA